MSYSSRPPDEHPMMLYSHPTAPDWVLVFEAACAHPQQLQLPMREYPHPFMAMVKGVAASRGLCTNCTLRVQSLVSLCMTFREPTPVNRPRTKRKDAP